VSVWAAATGWAGSAGPVPYGTAEGSDVASCCQQLYFLIFRSGTDLISLRISLLFLLLLVQAASFNKKALLSQRQPHDAPNIWVP